MEITYTQGHSYSLDLNARAVRDLADHLDITIKALRKLVDDEELFSEHRDALIEWVAGRADKAEVTSHDDIELDKIAW